MPGFDFIPQAGLVCFVQVTNAQRVIAAHQANTFRTARLGIIAAMMNAKRIRMSVAITVIYVFYGLLTFPRRISQKRGKGDCLPFNCLSVQSQWRAFPELKGRLENVCK